MRVKFTFNIKDKLVLPIHYNHLLQAFIYTNLKDKQLQIKYHDDGFSKGNKKFKMFTFSRINGTFMLDKDKGTITFVSPISFTVSSMTDSFLSSLIQDFVLTKDLYLNGTKLVIQSFEPFSPKIESTIAQIEMLSPLTVYHTENVGGKKFTHYYTPWEDEFEQLIAINLVDKYKTLHPDSNYQYSEVSIKPMFYEDMRYQKIIKFKTTVIKGWMGSFLLSAPIDLISQAYFSGIGAKNSEGFGCFKVFGTGET
jgi:CRISPR-associated endoribonuclease Cas6